VAASLKKIIGIVRETLHRNHATAFDALPDAWRQTLIATAETASRDRADVVWAIRECWLGLRDCGLAKVVDQTIAYYFRGTELSVSEFQELLAVARDAEAKGLNVRAMVEEAFRRKAADKLGDA
jgi:hypothetical protein